MKCGDCGDTIRKAHSHLVRDDDGAEYRICDYCHAHPNVVRAFPWQPESERAWEARMDDADRQFEDSEDR